MTRSTNACRLAAIGVLVGVCSVRAEEPGTLRLDAAGVDLAGALRRLAAEQPTLEYLVVPPTGRLHRDVSLAGLPETAIPDLAGQFGCDAASVDGAWLLAPAVDSADAGQRWLSGASGWWGELLSDYLRSEAEATQGGHPTGEATSAARLVCADRLRGQWRDAKAGLPELPGAGFVPLWLEGDAATEATVALWATLFGEALRDASATTSLFDADLSASPGGFGLRLDLVRPTGQRLPLGSVRFPTDDGVAGPSGFRSVAPRTALRIYIPPAVMGRPVSVEGDGAVEGILARVGASAGVDLGVPERTSGRNLALRAVNRPLWQVLNWLGIALGAAWGPPTDATAYRLDCGSPAQALYAALPLADRAVLLPALWKPPDMPDRVGRLWAALDEGQRSALREGRTLPGRELSAAQGKVLLESFRQMILGSTLRRLAEARVPSRGEAVLAAIWLDDGAATAIIAIGNGQSSGIVIEDGAGTRTMNRRAPVPLGGPNHYRIRSAGTGLSLSSDPTASRLTPLRRSSAAAGANAGDAPRQTEVEP